jgi:hypothetical protein
MSGNLWLLTARDNDSQEANAAVEQLEARIDLRDLDADPRLRDEWRRDYNF